MAVTEGDEAEHARNSAPVLLPPPIPPQPPPPPILPALSLSLSTARAIPSRSLNVQTCFVLTPTSRHRFSQKRMSRGETKGELADNYRSDSRDQRGFSKRKKIRSPVPRIYFSTRRDRKRAAINFHAFNLLPRSIQF